METRGSIHWHGKLHIIVQGTLHGQEAILGMKTTGYNTITVWLEISEGNIFWRINSPPFSPLPLLRMQTGLKCLATHNNDTGCPSGQLHMDHLMPGTAAWHACMERQANKVP